MIRRTPVAADPYTDKLDQTLQRFRDDREFRAAVLQDSSQPELSEREQRLFDDVVESHKRVDD